MGGVKPEVRYARNGDVAIAFALVGDGPADLVFVAPFGNLEVAWENPLFAQFLRRLATFVRVVIIDRRGTGLSDRYSSDDLPTLEDLVDDVTVVLDAVGTERAALFGFSDAGALCAMFAAVHPERVSGLILYATAARGTVAPDYPWQWSEEEWHGISPRSVPGGARRPTPSSRWRSSILRSWRRATARLVGQVSAPVGEPRLDPCPGARVPGDGCPSHASRDRRAPTLVLHRTDDAIEPVGKAGTSPTRSTVHGTSNCQAVTTSHGPAIKTRS